MLKHAIEPSLELLPRPEVLTTGIPLDRYGIFIPHVRRTGSAGVLGVINTYNNGTTASELQATWKLDLRPMQVSYNLTPFDDADGMPQPPGTEVTYTDKIKAAWLVDARRFKEDGFNGGLDFGDPEVPGSTHSIPQAELPVEMKAFVEKLANVNLVEGGFGPAPVQQRKVFVNSAEGTAPGTQAGTVRVAGSFQVPDLPAGKLAPSFIAETESGAFVRYDPPYGGGVGSASS